MTIENRDLRQPKRRRRESPVCTKKKGKKGETPSAGRQVREEQQYYNFETGYWLQFYAYSVTGSSGSIRGG